jgi:hypothetical protein
MLTFLQVTVLRKKKTFSEEDVCASIWHEQRFSVLIVSIYCKQKVESFQMCDKIVEYKIMSFKETKWDYRWCIFLTSDMDCWREFRKPVIKFHIPQNAEDFLELTKNCLLKKNTVPVNWLFRRVEPPNVGEFSSKYVILTETEVYVMCCRLACTSIIFLSRDNDIICNTMTSRVKVGLSTQGTVYGVFFYRNGRGPKRQVLCWEHFYVSPFSPSHTVHATFALNHITALKRKCPLSALRWVYVSSLTCQPA